MTDEQSIRYLGDVQRLSLKPGDMIVLSTTMKLSPIHAAGLREQVRKLIPGHEVIILSDGLKIGVLEAVD